MSIVCTHCDRNEKRIDRLKAENTRLRAALEASPKPTQPMAAYEFWYRIDRTEALNPVKEG